MVDDIGAIGAGRAGGSSIDELEASRESSGSVRGASGRDLRLERGMLGYRGTRRAITMYSVSMVATCNNNYALAHLSHGSRD